MKEGERIVSYLPLSHVAGQVFDFMASLVAPVSIHFAQPDALSGSLVETLKEVRPTIFLAVPRIYEKMEEKMKGVAASVGPVARSISNWAKSKGYANAINMQNSKGSPFGYSFASWLILKRVKDALGLDQCKICIFGAAPMKKSTLEYFLSLDMHIYNFYGMSETAAAQTIAWKNRVRFDRAGQTCPGTHIKIFNPDEQGRGEICFKGRN